MRNSDCAKKVFHALMGMAIGLLGAASAAELTYEVPYAEKPPTLDGKMDPMEWRDSVVIPSGAGMPRQAYFHLMWREDALYLAQVSPLRPGERPLRRFRDPEKGADCHDDTCEVYVSTDQLGQNGRTPEFFQVIFGPVDDVIWYQISQYSIGQVVSNWRPGWESRNGITPDGKNWVTECRIPVKGFFYQGELKDGATWKLNFCRDWKRPWQWGGFGYVSPPSPKAVFRKQAPAVKLAGIESLNFGTPDATVTIDPLGKPVKGTAEIRITQDKAVIVEQNMPLDLDGNTPLVVGPFPDAKITKGKAGEFNATLKNADGAVFYRWSVPFVEGNHEGVAFEPPTDAFFATLSSNPLREISFLQADFDELDEAARAKISTASAMLLDERGKSLGEFPAPTIIDHHCVIQAKWPSDLPYGAYRFHISLRDEAGKEISSVDKPFSKLDPVKEFPWWGNTVGFSRNVLEPWTPVVADETSSRVWGRKIVFAETGLPAQVTSQGQPLLAGPVILVGTLSDGSPMKIEGRGVKLLERAQDRGVHEGVFAGSGIVGTARAETEFDGCAKFTVKIKPEGQAVKLKELAILIPYHATRATHFRANTWPKISFYAGKTPAGQGVVWESRSINDDHPLAVGYFIPYIWLGTQDVGLCWFAGNDKGWWPTETRSAQELVRDGDAVILRLNLAAEEVTLDGEREIVFGMQANPVKPLARMPDPLNSTSFNGPVREGRVDLAVKDVSEDAQIQRPRPSNWDVSRKSVAAGRANGIPSVPYIAHTDPGAIDPKEMDYFTGAWTGRGPAEIGSHTFMLALQRSYADYYVYWFDQWVRECGVSGFYVDNTWCCIVRNPDMPPSYRLPDGRVQGGFTIWEDREFMRRLQTVLQQRGVRPLTLWSHMTHCPLIPILSFCDDALQGEDRRISPGGANFMQYWSREDLESSLYSPAFGWRCHFLGAWESCENKAWAESGDPNGERDMRSEVAALWPLGIRMTTFGNSDVARRTNWTLYGFTGQRTTLPRLMFTATPDFASDPASDPIPYWRTKELVKVSQPEVDVTLWKQPERLMLMLGNRNPKDGPVTLTIPLGAFWKPRQEIGGDFRFAECRVLDQETGGELDRAYDLERHEVSFTLPLRGFDFRILQIVR